MRIIVVLLLSDFLCQHPAFWHSGKYPEAYYKPISYVRCVALLTVNLFRDFFELVRFRFGVLNMVFGSEILPQVVLK